MYQIAMSFIHDNAVDSRHDADSIVTGIATREIAFAVAVDYAKQFHTAYDVPMSLGDCDTPEVPLRLWAPFNGVTGTATCYVEVQLTPVRTDAADILNHLNFSARYTANQPGHE